MPCSERGQVLLGDPVVAIGVRVEIALAVAKAFVVAVAVLEMIGHAAVRLRAHLLQRIEEGKGGVGLLGRGQIERGRGQVEAAFGHAHLLEGLGAGVDHLDGVGVGHAHILAGEDQHAAEDEARRLAGIDHLGHPVHRRIGVAAAQALDEGADRVEVVVAFLVVEHGAALDRFFGDGEGDVEIGRLEIGDRRLAIGSRLDP